MHGGNFIMHSERPRRDYKAENERMLKLLDGQIGEVDGVLKAKDEQYGWMDNFKKDGKWYTQGDETFNLTVEACNVNSIVEKLKWTNLWGQHWLEFQGSDEEFEGTILTHWKVRWHDGRSGSARHQAKLEGRDYRIPVWLNK